MTSAEYESILTRFSHSLNAGLWNEAEIAAQRLIATRPDLALSWKALGTALLRSGNIEGAISALKEAVNKASDDPEICNNLGIALRSASKPGDAHAYFVRAVELAPSRPEFHFNLGNSYRNRDHFTEAERHYLAALTRRPLHIKAAFNLALVLHETHRSAEAATRLRFCVEHQPDFAEAWATLSLVLRELDDLNAAIDAANRAIEINPALSIAYRSLGFAEYDLGRISAAERHLKRAVELDPTDAESHAFLAVLNYDIGTTDTASDLYSRAAELRPQHLGLLTAKIFFSNYEPNSPPPNPKANVDLHRLRTAIAQKTQDQTAPAESRDVKKLKVGLLSPDFYSHPVGYFLETLLSSLDRKQFDFVGYFLGTKKDSQTNLLSESLTELTDVSHLDPGAVSERIRKDGVQILLELSGMTSSKALQIASYKPAPVQVTWLGYFATTGVEAIDYILGDPYVTPEGEEDHFTERVWRLPQIYCCFSEPRYEVLVGELPALSNGYVTFGSFNNLAKVNDQVVSLWSRVLQAVPGSKLLLKTKALADEGVRGRLRDRFGACGVGAERLILEGPAPRGELLAAYNRVDIGLDPFPYPGGTTTAEALWMGVPVLTRRGDRFLSHVGETMAYNTGQGEWVAADEGEYVAKARAFAADLAALAALRARLRHTVLKSPLYDAPTFAKNLTEALHSIWQFKLPFYSSRDG